MSHASRSNRILAIALLVSTCLLAIAPVAEAGRRHRAHRHKGSHAWCRVDHHGHDHAVVVRQSGPGPVLAGLVGGFIIGTAYARSTPVVHTVAYTSAPRYRYWDPYCDTWHASLSDCRAHGQHGGHPHIVKVFDDGRCVRTMQWSAGAWYDIDDEDWRD
jgi:hypothetical protein